ncbi:DUF5647 family protein [Dictyobacter formicarum]|uniref:Uncharacterized protein n=1 Tax=Dictyobacter formicarum TaxID=2778368 RepID=A0ABQ3VHF9_9CHLR|nr:DUF5647 family protein [Dictyobacter formicarum]GHO85243.1 hypothetical protein KSZ_32490 [Dictyobacter formicarum]
MSKQQQVEKNLELAEKLADYIVAHPEATGNLPKNVSYVAFSATDTTINQENEKLIEGLKKEGKTVIKAQETKDAENPWRLTPVL